MKIELSQLDQIQVASPCTASWDAMKGDDRVRFCGECSKHVYRFEGMSRSEILDLIRNSEGEICVRLSRRRDGTVVTNDCPVGVDRARHRRRLAFLVACLPLAVFGMAIRSGAKPVAEAKANVGTALARLEELWDEALVQFGLQSAPKTVTITGGCPAPPTMMGRAVPKPR